MSDHSDSLDQLALGLCSFQAEVGEIPKSATNPFFNSRYAPLSAVIAVAAPVLTKHGLSVMQCPSHDEAGDTLTTWLLHKSGQWVRSTMRLRPIKNDPQAQGSALTYARRYAYMAVLGLVADDDDDGNAATKAAVNGRTAKPTPSPVEDRGEDKLCEIASQAVSAGRMTIPEVITALIAAGAQNVPGGENPKTHDITTALRSIPDDAGLKEFGAIVAKALEEVVA